ncbi:hypothetical protein [Pedobacter sp.]
MIQNIGKAKIAIVSVFLIALFTKIDLKYKRKNVASTMVYRCNNGKFDLPFSIIIIAAKLIKPELIKK